MYRISAAVLSLAILAACSGGTRSGGTEAMRNMRAAAASKPPAFALPGVPLLTEQQAAAREMEEQDLAARQAPEKAPESAPPAVQPEPAPASPSGEELDFHLGAARKYASRKKYRSAAAEYGAALGFLAPGDTRAVHVLERQGAMLLRAGDEAKAKESFAAAIGKAGELSVSGNDLANSHLGLGYCLEKAGQVPDAIANYEKVLKHSRSAAVKRRVAETIAGLKAGK